MQHTYQVELTEEELVIIASAIQNAIYDKQERIDKLKQFQAKEKAIEYQEHKLEVLLHLDRTLIKRANRLDV